MASSVARCACGARIIWAITENRRRQPLDHTPDPAGIVAAYQDHLGGWHSRHAPPGEQLTPPWKRYTSHFATCPKAGQYRKPTDGQRQAAQDVRDELAAMRAKRAKDQRNRRGRRPAAGYQPGMNIWRPR